MSRHFQKHLVGRKSSRRAPHARRRSLRALEWLEPRALLTAAAMAPPVPGTLDTAFGGTGVLQTTPDTSDYITKVIAHADHTLLVGGSANNEGTRVYEGFVALNDAYGSPEWVTAVPQIQQVLGMAELPGGSIVVEGITQNSPYEYAVVKLDNNGQIDSSFNNGSGVWTSDWHADPATYYGGLAIQTLGGASYIVLAGTDATNEQDNFTVERLNADGTTDTSFNAADTPGKASIPIGVSQNVFVSDLAIDQTDNILVAGVDNTDGSFRVVRFTPNGTVDTTFGTGQNGIADEAFTGQAQYGEPVSLVQEANGTLMVGGTLFVTESDGSGGTAFALAHYDDSGTLLSSNSSTHFSTGGYTGDENLGQLQLDASGDIIAAGQTASPAANGIAVARYTPDGNLDTSSGQSGLFYIPAAAGADVYAAAVDPTSGDWIVAGDNAETSHSLLARVIGVPAGGPTASSGTLDTTFGDQGIVTTDFTLLSGLSSSLNGNEINKVIAHADGTLLVGGSANKTGPGVYEGFVALVNEANGVSEWVTPTPQIQMVLGMAELPDGSIVVEGITPDSPYHYAVVKLDAAGNVDTSFANDGVWTSGWTADSEANGGLAIQMLDETSVDPGPYIVLGGSQISPGGGAGFTVERLTANGTPDPDFGTNGEASLPSGSETAVATALLIDHQSDGIVVAGVYDEDNSFRLARFTQNGKIDLKFGTGGDGIAAEAFVGQASGSVTGVQDNDGQASESVSVVQEDDGTLMVGGAALLDKGGNSNKDFALAHYDDSGQLLSTSSTDFSTGSDDAIAQLQLDPYGDIVAVGVTAPYHSYGGPSPQIALARYTTGGDLDTSIGQNGLIVVPASDFATFHSVTASALAIDRDGNWVAAGGGETYGSLSSLVAMYGMPAADLTLTGVLGVSFNQTVATFSEVSGDANADDYSATIDWGDGEADSDANISGPDANGNFTVSGSHVYTDQYVARGDDVTVRRQVTVTIQKEGVSGAPSATIATDYDLAALASPPLQSPTTTDLRSSSPQDTETSAYTSVYGQPVTFTAAVSANDGGTPTGSVQFYDDGATLGGAVTLDASQGNSAAYTTSTLTAGPHTITAEYEGDANDAVSTATDANRQSAVDHHVLAISRWHWPQRRDANRQSAVDHHVTGRHRHQSAECFHGLGRRDVLRAGRSGGLRLVGRHAHAERRRQPYR